LAKPENTAALRLG